MGEPGYRALLIGNSTFPNDPHNLQNLEGPVNDIALLRDALTDPDTGLFDQHDVRLLPERSMSEILVELERFFGGASRTDRLFLYYSGHGLMTMANRLLLAARDSRTDLLLATTVSATAINGMIEASAAQTTVIMLDCCYSGAFKGTDLPASLQGNGRYLLTSTRGSELANDADRTNGTSQFTTHLVEGLRAGAPDRDGDGFVDLDDLYEHVHRQLGAIGRQMPQRNFSGGGSVLVARRRSAAVLDPDPDPEPSSEWEEDAADKGPGSASDAQPVLDVSETVIDLRDVHPDEVLPPERVAVFNRGGGRLDWVARTDADWLAVRPDGDDVRIELHPRPGRNRGTVLVRDRAGGGARTIRVQVQVAPEQPPPREVPHEPSTREPRPTPPAGQGETKRWWEDWRTPVIAGVVAVLTVFAVAGALTEDDPPSTASYEIAVDGATAWTDTGIDLDTGEWVEVTATGAIFHSEVDSIGPEGIPDSLHFQSPVADVNHAALLARVGDGGTPFYVGPSSTFTADTAGRLQLGPNDGDLGNNRGEFTASIEVSPTAPE